MFTLFYLSFVYTRTDGNRKITCPLTSLAQWTGFKVVTRWWSRLFVRRSQRGCVCYAYERTRVCERAHERCVINTPGLTKRYNCPLCVALQHEMRAVHTVHAIPRLLRFFFLPLASSRCLFFSVPDAHRKYTYEKGYAPGPTDGSGRI